MPTINVPLEFEVKNPDGLTVSSLALRFSKNSLIYETYNYSIPIESQKLSNISFNWLWNFPYDANQKSYHIVEITALAAEKINDVPISGKSSISFTIDDIPPPGGNNPSTPWANQSSYLWVSLGFGYVEHTFSWSSSTSPDGAYPIIYLVTVDGKTYERSGGTMTLNLMSSTVADGFRKYEWSVQAKDAKGRLSDISNGGTVTVRRIG